MKMRTIKTVRNSDKQTESNRKPHTSRGRALFTVDWYLNGKIILNDHDSPNVGIRDLKKMSDI